jgi:hypothetical protein
METMASRPTTGILQDVRNLAARLQHGGVFRHYLRKRRERVALLVVLCVAISFACTSGVILFVLGSRPIFVLVGVLASPFVLLGSLVVTLYVAFSWLENLALAHALPHAAKPALPAIPWGPAALFVLAPFALLVLREPAVGLLLGALAVGAPVLYARFDKQGPQKH